MKTKKKNNIEAEKSVDKQDFIIQLLYQLLKEIEKLKKNSVSAEEIFNPEFISFGGKK